MVFRQKDANGIALQLGLARLIEISVNWSINNRKTIIDEQKETIDYLQLPFCKEIHEKLQLYFAFSVFETLVLVDFTKTEVESMPESFGRFGLVISVDTVNLLVNLI